MKKMKKLAMLAVALYVGLHAHAQNGLTAAPGGKVGIGNTAPVQKLDVVDTITSIYSSFNTTFANPPSVFSIANRAGIDGSAASMIFMARNTAGSNTSAYIAGIANPNNPAADLAMGRRVTLAGGNNVAYSEIMRIAATGKVGIGNPTPAQKLDVIDTLTDVYVPVNGPAAYPASVLSLTNRAAVDGSATTLMFMVRNAAGANTVAYVAGISNPTGASADLAIGRRDMTSGGNANIYNESMRFVGATGNVGIGTTTPGTYKLAVEGTIGARKVKVTTTSWADFVFDPNYKRRTLEETEAFILANKHLPDVPSADDVVKDGQDLGEMNKILLQKVEELTLELIEMKKEIKEMKAKKK